ncbi:GIY-YIG nuclease family protein [Azospirillum sp. TSO5]|uniref:GIY-YIG nuclease family protein n=1 Tax=Azospirillum sp. TSO5 TaxID=716760 RepID=UPI000D61FF23|nr:GIY-YIG nuclease family protein [Azospirillum sp. TSO5]PWC92936.1 hypothetical protein TSO5_16035 [Azospirillum sp. TSO5]
MRPSTHKRDEGFPEIEVSLYCVTNTVNGKRYIGITYIPLEKRWKQHLYEAFGLESQRALYCAIRKYGAESFTVELLELLNDWGEAGEREKHYIRLFDTMCNGGHGYNMTAGADGVLGVPPPPEAVERAKESIRRRADERAERLRPSVEELMADGFLNFREFAGRMNRAGIPTLKGGARWGIGNVKAVLERLGYDMPLLERKALEDKVHARNVAAMRQAADERLALIKDQFDAIMATGPDSLHELVRRLNAAGVPTPKDRAWVRSTAKSAATRLGYDVEDLIRQGREKMLAARPVVVNHVLYPSLKKAEEMTGDKHIIRSINAGRRGFYYADEGQRTKPPRKVRRPPVPVSVQGTVYEHAADAGRALGVKPDTVTNRCRSARFPDHFFCDRDGRQVPEPG